MRYTLVSHAIHVKTENKCEMKSNSEKFQTEKIVFAREIRPRGCRFEAFKNAIRIGICDYMAKHYADMISLKWIKYHLHSEVCIPISTNEFSIVHLMAHSIDPKA